MDARLTELELLARMEREGGVHIGPLGGAERDLAVFLVVQGYVNSWDIPWQQPQGLLSSGMPGESQLERLVHQRKIETLSKVMGSQAVSLRIAHAGRLRMAELTQELRTGKIREAFGILWDGRHFERDLRIQLLGASAQSSLALAYMDLNGMKNVNDNIGHIAGDVVLRAYFDSIAASLGDQGDAYRLGGDEVGVILSGTTLAGAEKIVRQASVLLMNERLREGDRDIPKVSVAAGIVIADGPDHTIEALRRAADDAMYRAKEFTAGREPRPSSLAVEGEGKIRLFQPDVA